MTTATRRRSADRPFPRRMEARYRGTCAETGETIAPGDPIWWDPTTRRTYHADTDTGRRWAQQAAADADRLADAGH